MSISSRSYQSFQKLPVMNFVGAIKMPERTGLVAMQPAGAAIERFLDLDDKARIG
jgi:hypothetical protein